MQSASIVIRGLSDMRIDANATLSFEQAVDGRPDRNSFKIVSFPLLNAAIQQ